MRYFMYSVHFEAINYKNSFFKNFEYVSESYPTENDLIQDAKNIHDKHWITILAITEMSEDDFNNFWK